MMVFDDVIGLIGPNLLHVEGYSYSNLENLGLAVGCVSMTVYRSKQGACSTLSHTILPFTRAQMTWTASYVLGGGQPIWFFCSQFCSLFVGIQLLFNVTCRHHAQAYHETYRPRVFCALHMDTAM